MSLKGICFVIFNKNKNNNFLLNYIFLNLDGLKKLSLYNFVQNII